MPDDTIAMVPMTNNRAARMSADRARRGRGRDVVCWTVCPSGICRRIDETRAEPGDNPLPRFLPHEVPAGIRLVCAMRPTYPHLGWIEARSPTRRIDLDDRRWAASNEAVVRGFSDVVEFRTTVTEAHAMRAISVDLELAPDVDRAAIIDRVAIRLKEALGVSVRVQAVETGALPRFEMKAKRFVVEV